MTSQPLASGDDPAAGTPPAICKRPGCGQPLPAPGRGRTRQFCTDDCARRYHNDARLPATAPAITGIGGDDPLDSLEALTRQAAACVRAAREQAASLDPARVRAQIAEAEAARRRAEAATVTADARAAEAEAETQALTEALTAADAAAREQANAARPPPQPRPPSTARRLAATPPPRSPHPGHKPASRSPPPARRRPRRPRT